MRNIIQIPLFILLVTIFLSFSSATGKEKKRTYTVIRLREPVSLNGKWDNLQWQKCKALKINNFLGESPSYRPFAEAKIGYNDENLFVIFRVKDRFVRSVSTEINGPVWEDSCVEFFFAPDQNEPDKYFNLEVNSGGTALMRYNIIPRIEFKILKKEEIEKIRIQHSLPKITDPERTDSVTWTIEYAVPFSVLQKYSSITIPKKGVCWKANLYKIADKTSNPHYISWLPIENGVIDFHQPHFFGTLKFE